MNKRRVATGLVLAAAGAIAGCSALDRGPEPSNYVGRGPAPHSLTDQNLDAVTPAAPTVVQGVTEYSAMTLPGEAVTPGTMPSATQPGTTQPALPANPHQHPGLSTAPASQPTPTRNAQGHVDVPESLDMQNAILVGLQNNVNLRVERLNVPIQRTAEDVERAAFDPSISGEISGGVAAVRRGPRLSDGTPPVLLSRKGTDYSGFVDGNITLSQSFPTGTAVDAHFRTANDVFASLDKVTTAGVGVTQSLLRGAGVDVNLARLREAELDTKITQFQLRGFAESLVATIEKTYWDLAYAERQVVIVENALKVAQEELDSTRGSIKVGKIAPTEEAAALAQVEVEKEDLINAKSTLETTRLNFLRLITPAGEPFWNRTITLKTQPFIPVGTMDPVEQHVQVGLKFRPEVNQTKLQIQQNDLEIVRTRNGLLPQLDFFVNLDKTGFSTQFFPSIGDLGSPDYAASIGVRGSYAFENRAARASYLSSTITKQQTEESFRNLLQTIQIDVRTQYIEVMRSREQIDATRATREADQTSLEVETAKFRAGRSTSLLVAQAQQNLLAAQLSEVQAVTTHLKALVDLYRLEGSLLFRRGLDAPGAKPVEGREWH